MRYRVVTLPSAEAEARAAYLWLYERSPAAAVRWYRELRRAIESLGDHPGRCPLAPENECFEEEIRQLLYGRGSGVYRILFTVGEDSVFVLFVRHGARQWLGPHTPSDEAESESEP